MRPAAHAPFPRVQHQPSQRPRETSARRSGTGIFGVIALGSSSRQMNPTSQALGMCSHRSAGSPVIDQNFPGQALVGSKSVHRRRRAVFSHLSRARARGSGSTALSQWRPSSSRRVGSEESDVNAEPAMWPTKGLSSRHHETNHTRGWGSQNIQVQVEPSEPTLRREPLNEKG